MKAIALVVVQGGIAYVYAPEHVDVRVVDLDNMEDDDPDCRERLPRDVGFEKLVEDAELEYEKHFLWEPVMEMKGMMK